MTRLFQFRAGRCERRGETNIVDPLPSKGLLYVEHNEEDGVLNHLCYKDLESGAVIDDFIIFAGDASFQKVLVPDSATARVYALCFSSSNQKLLYWMQDPDPTTDAANVARLNQLIVDDGQMAMEYSDPVNESRAASSDQVSPTGPAAPPPNGVSGDLATAPRHPSGGIADGCFGSGMTDGNEDEQMNRLQSIIAGLGQNGGSTGQPAYRLGDILTMEVLEPMLEDESMLASVASYLPTGIAAEAGAVGRVLRSADFRAAVDSFDHALSLSASGHPDNGLAMFLRHGLGLDAAQCNGIDGYINSLLNRQDHSNH